jgi:hypothetical protein
MAKEPRKEIEFHPDAMERFERAVKAIAKAPSQHRDAPKPPAKERTTKK